MNKSVAMLSTMLALAVASPAFSATTVAFNGGTGALPASVTVIEDFEGFAANAPIGTNASVYANSVNNVAARPAFGSTGKFAAVRSGGTYTINFAATDTLAFVLGSLDTYNTLTLRYADNSSQAYAGGQIINDLSFPSGDRISGETNGVVSYIVTSGALLTGATFTASGNSFEIDNIATAAVPEPATWAMMLGGLGFVGAMTRRRSRPAFAHA